jgi:hypothetical protein
VSTSGSDLDPGTETRPFKTIQKAANVVSAGDTVIVEDGVYTDLDGDGAIVTLNRGGTSANKVVFKARNKWGAKLDGKNNLTANGFVFGSNGNYIRIEGFEVYGVGKANGSSSGFEVYNGGHDVELVANKIHDVGRLCTDTTNGQVGMFIEQPRVTIERNLIYDIGRFAPGENGCSPSGISYQNHDHGIYLDGTAESSGISGANNAVVKNNIFYNLKRGWAIQIYPGSLTGILIANNTFAFENPYQVGHIILGANLTNSQITNNIFYDPKTAAINFYTGTKSGVLINNNITYGGVIKSSSPSGVTFTANLDNIDPLFAKVGIFDFHLQSSSPARGAGISLAAVVDDFDGLLRLQLAVSDVGAYQFR